MQKNYNLYKKSVNLLVSVCVVFLTTTVAPATEKPSCDEVLTSCLVYTDLLEQERDLMVEAIKRQQKTIDELESKQPSQPWYFWMIMGAASGIILIGVR